MQHEGILARELLEGYARLLARRQRRRRRGRIALACTGGALVFAAVGLAAAQVLGWPAPDAVRAGIAGVDQGMPADLRLDPDVENARAVASNGDATLYAASLKSGGFCTEIVTAGDRGRGANCTTTMAREFQVSAAADTEGDAASPIIVGGRVSVAGATSVTVSYVGSEEADEVALEDEGFFLFQVPVDHLAAAHAGGLNLVASDGGGRTVGTTAVPSDFDDPPVPDRSQQLFVSTRSDSADLTKVYGVEGFVGDEVGVALELRYGDGGRVPIAIDPDRSFSYTVPSDRVGAFMTRQTLVLLDARGRELASRPVAAVALLRAETR